MDGIVVQNLWTNHRHVSGISQSGSGLLATRAQEITN